MKFKSLAITLVAGVATLMSMQAFAQQFTKSEDAVKYRQSAFFVTAQHFGPLGAMANGRAPFDAAQAKKHADVLAVVAALPLAGFGDGTEGGKSKAEIWKEKAKFNELGQNYTTEMGKLVTAAKTGDLAQLKAAFGPAAQTCKACHDAFRSR